MTVIVTLKEHLDYLQAEEGRRPPSHRRSVPSIPELAEAVGISKQGLYNLAGGQVKLVNLELLGSIINELRRRGFSVGISDLLTAFPADTVGAKESDKEENNA